MLNWINKYGKNILIGELLLIIFLELLIFYLPKVESYLAVKSAENRNEETLAQITDEDIITAKKSVELPEITSPKIVLPETDYVPKIIRDSDAQIPEKAYLEVPFFCQAPLETEQNWLSHEASCEEAALLMAYLYETGQTMTKKEADTKILDMIEWEISHLGSHHDLYAAELKKFAQEFYQIDPAKITVVEDAEIDDIRKFIAQGDPVIVPITASLLDNPYYPYPGYHMLIVIGYTAENIITNDNGTRHGANYSYDAETFIAAMKDAGGDIIVLDL